MKALTGAASTVSSLSVSKIRCCSPKPHSPPFPRGQALAQPSTPTQPRQCPLHYPPARQYHKLTTTTRSPHYLQYTSCTHANPLNQRSSITTVRPDEPQSFNPLCQSFNQSLCAFPVLYVRRMNRHFQQHPYRDHDYMPLSARHLLSRVIAARSPFP